MAQRDEIARLKGLKGRPSIKPSGMDNATGLKRGGKRVKRRRRGKVTSRVVPEIEVLRVAHPTNATKRCQTARRSRAQGPQATWQGEVAFQVVERRVFAERANE
jgi:hypothetical protein